MIVDTKIVIKAIMQRPEILLIFIHTTNEQFDLRILGSLLIYAFKTSMNTIPIVGAVRRLLCRRINNGPAFVKNCKSDMAKEILHL